jgi:hypothetical protein
VRKLTVDRLQGSVVHEIDFSLERDALLGEEDHPSAERLLGPIILGSLDFLGGGLIRLWGLCLWGLLLGRSLVGRTLLVGLLGRGVGLGGGLRGLALAGLRVQMTET